MYTPKHFEFENEAEKIAFMKKYSFATIVTNKAGLPIATQIPFLITQNAGQLVLSGHFALANEQAGYIEENTSLVIFSEPHAYISPVHYDKMENVPTWNYVAVHAYGKAKIVEEENAKIKALESMILFYEPGYLEQWNHLSAKFKKGMARGIAVFDLEVTDLQGKKKISQNKAEAERQKIASYLEKSELSSERAIADLIRKK
ncbi:transcriptional regulator [Pedobacter cryoconitis]|uniref:Transcriptional regulator n=1 Tax=Pedobacter cryoconitis TaxID=188932 RepID=A0A7W9E0W8_9SPHI|nr:FMN-binding negative transcriptional regulator [Pedobacter cryoconitis]MBB5638408.1 transcriptional regulator [Pedobacter cryoconitis]